MRTYVRILQARAALSSRPERGLTVCVNQDGLSRALDDTEQREVDERVRELRSLAGEVP